MIEPGQVQMLKNLRAKKTFHKDSGIQFDSILEKDNETIFVMHPINEKLKLNPFYEEEPEEKLKSKAPPAYLYFGTDADKIEYFEKNGIQPSDEDEITLYESIKEAKQAALTFPNPAVLFIRASKMYKSDFIFRVSSKDIWFTKEIPTEFIMFD